MGKHFSHISFFLLSIGINSVISTGSVIDVACTGSRTKADQPNTRKMSAVRYLYKLLLNIQLRSSVSLCLNYSC